MTDYLVIGTDLEDVADAIRTAGETSSPLTWPDGFIAAIGNISGGGGTDISDTTAVEADVLAGKYFHKADGTKVQGSIVSKSSSDLTASGATVTVPAGHYAAQASKSVSSGSATAPATISASSATVSTGTNTLMLSKTVSVTPSVSAGYVSSGTAGNSTVSLTASVTTKGTATITPTTTNQEIAAGTYITGKQTIAGSSNLVAGNIKKNVQIFNVTGTYEGAGGGTDVSDTTTTAADALAGTYFHIADGTKVEGTIATKSGTDLTASGATVTVPAGYYASQATKSVTSGSATAPASISGTSATISTGSGTLTLSKTVSVTPSVSAGYVSSGTAGNSSVSLTASATINPTPTASGDTVTVPAGYYTTSTTKSVSAGTAGTPTATKGTVSNHSVSVTPSVTNTTGYITGSTKTGTAVTVSASELVSGSETKTANGTYDVTNLASLVVNVSGSGGGLGTLIATSSLGTLSTSSTSASDTGKSMDVSDYNDYDLMLVDVSVDTVTNGRHTSTVSTVYLTGTSNVTTKNTYTVGSNKWNSKVSSSGTKSTRQSTTAYGIYVNAASVSNSKLHLTFYYRYNSNSTSTLNGTYTARVYGIKLIDLIGG